MVYRKRAVEVLRYYQEDKTMKSEGDQGSNARTFLLRKSEMKSDWNLVKIACRNAPAPANCIRALTVEGVDDIMPLKGRGVGLP